MQSSCSIIKKSSVDLLDEINIKTSYENIKTIEISNDEEMERSKESLTSIRKLILGNVSKEKEEIIKFAYEKAELIEKETYEKAYREGLANGREDGYKAAFDENIETAKMLVEDAKQLLVNSKVEYENYLESKREEIINLAYKITEHLLEKSLRKEDGINDFVLNVLKKSRENKAFVIRCNESHMDSVRDLIEKEKEDLSLKAEIYFIADKNVKEGNVLIELDKGKVEVGLDNAINSIKNEIF